MRYLVQTSGNLDFMFTREHFVVEADSHDDAASKALKQADGPNYPTTGLHLVDLDGDPWTSWSYQYMVADIPLDQPLTEEQLNEWWSEHEQGYLMVVGPLHE